MSRNAVRERRLQSRAITPSVILNHGQRGSERKRKLQKANMREYAVRVVEARVLSCPPIAFSGSNEKAITRGSSALRISPTKNCRFIFAKISSILGRLRVAWNQPFTMFRLPVGSAFLGFLDCDCIDF